MEENEEGLYIHFDAIYVLSDNVGRLLRCKPEEERKKANSGISGSNQ